jgi:peptidoglycan/LPS O-acetylase OafA/YrhL
MSAFDLVFALFGLLLGLAVAEVLGGFARVLKLKRAAKPVRVGWLTPLLGLFVMLDLTSFWGTAYVMRDQMDASYLTLVVVLAVVGVYHLAASLIFPDTPEEWPDFDDWYDRQNRMVIGGMLFANMVTMVGQGVLEVIRPVPAEPDGPLAPWGDVILLGGFAALVAMLVGLLIVNNRRWNVAMLVALNLILLTVSVAEDYI